MQARFSQKFFVNAPDHASAWIVAFIDAVPEAHQTERIVLIFGATNGIRNAILRSNRFQHRKNRFIGAAVQRPPHRGNPRSYTSERLAPASAARADPRR